MEEKLKILAVDDTIVYRQILTNVVAELKNVELTGTAPNGKIALSKIEMSPPDLVLLDVSMPVMDGLETLKAIREKYPDIDVIMVSGADTGNANMTVKALNLGALDFVIKPQGSSAEENLNFLKSSLSPLVNLVRTRKFSRLMRKISSGAVKQETRPSKPIQPEKYSAPSSSSAITLPQEKRKPGKIEVIGLGVSTGGPNALQKLIPMLGKELRVPILAVQHMPPMFTASLAERLNKDSKIDVVEAKEGDTIIAGKMYIAPGGYHMVVRKGHSGNSVGIIDTPPVNSCRPSVDVLFRSMAMIYGGNMLTVVLTGMGNDGAAGVSAIRRKGGYSIVQDEATCVVWGMPQAVYEANDADEVLPLEKISDRIMDIAGYNI